MNAQILVVNLTLREAKSRLYRRENGKINEVHTPPENEALNSVHIETLCCFENVNHVIYTCIGANIEGLTAQKLAYLAICSARNLDDGRDGISYLMNATRAGIATPLSGAYEIEILKQTGTTKLRDALKTCRLAVDD